MGYCTGNCDCGVRCRSSDDFCTQHECGACEDERIEEEFKMKNESKKAKPQIKKSLDEWADEFVETSTKAGWGKIEYNGVSFDDLIKHVPVLKDMFEGWTFAAGIANIGEEVSELWTAFRKHQLNELCDKADEMKKLGLRPLTYLEEECADLIIRTTQFMRRFGVKNIEECIHIKNEYNKSRSHKHGGKLV
jgi:hypothetical protein